MMGYWYRYTFEDGYYLISHGLSEEEIAKEESEHGKLVRVTYEGRF